MIVPDSSAVLDVLLATSASEAIAARILRVGETLHAPHLLDVEVAQVLRRYVRAGTIAESRGREGLLLLRDLPLHRYAHEPLLPRVWALRHNLTACDAVFVALAEALDAVLVTRDSRLAGSSGHAARIELF